MNYIYNYKWNAFHFINNYFKKRKKKFFTLKLLVVPNIPIYNCWLIDIYLLIINKLIINLENKKFYLYQYIIIYNAIY